MEKIPDEIMQHIERTAKRYARSLDDVGDLTQEGTVWYLELAKEMGEEHAKNRVFGFLKNHFSNIYKKHHPELAGDIEDEEGGQTSIVDYASTQEHDIPGIVDTKDKLRTIRGKLTGLKAKVFDYLQKFVQKDITRSSESLLQQIADAVGASYQEVAHAVKKIKDIAAEIGEQLDAEELNRITESLVALSEGLVAEPYDTKLVLENTNRLLDDVIAIIDKVLEHEGKKFVPTKEWVQKQINMAVKGNIGGNKDRIQRLIAMAKETGADASALEKVSTKVGECMTDRKVVNALIQMAEELVKCDAIKEQHKSKRKPNRILEGKAQASCTQYIQSGGTFLPTGPIVLVRQSKKK